MSSPYPCSVFVITHKLPNLPQMVCFNEYAHAFAHVKTLVTEHLVPRIINDTRIRDAERDLFIQHLPQHTSLIHLNKACSEMLFESNIFDIHCTTLDD